MTAPACHAHPDLPPDAWYALDGEAVAQAVQACHRCPLQAPCAEAGEGERYGVWGGLPRDHAQVTALRRYRHTVSSPGGSVGPVVTA